MKRITAVLMLASLLTMTPAAADPVEDCADYATGEGAYTLLWGVGQALGGQPGWSVIQPVWIGVGVVLFAQGAAECAGVP